MVTGVLQGNWIVVSSSDLFSIVQYTDQTGRPYKLGELRVETANVLEEFDIQLPIIGTDADGDSENSTIDITLNPVAPPPIVLDLDGDGAEFLGLNAGVAYDYGYGLVGTAWAGADDGILVRDGNGNGLVDDASEFVFGGNGMTDMEALHAQYGAQLDASDADFTMFAVWNDANSNGVVDGNELQSLAEAGSRGAKVLWIGPPDARDDVKSVEFQDRAGGDCLRPLQRHRRPVDCRVSEFAVRGRARTQGEPGLTVAVPEVGAAEFAGDFGDAAVGVAPGATGGTRVVLEAD